MGRSYAEKIADLELERAALEHDLQYASSDHKRMLKARLASLARSVRWYSARLRSSERKAGTPAVTTQGEE